MWKDKAALLTLGIFLSGYAVLGLTGVTSTGHLLDNLIAGYLLAWGLYGFLSDLPRREIRVRFVLMTLAGVVLLGLAELLGRWAWLIIKLCWARRDGPGLTGPVMSEILN